MHDVEKYTSKILWPSLLFGLGPLFGLCFMKKKNKYHLSPQFLVPNFSRNDTVLHLESLNFGFGSPFGPCFMKNRVLAGSLFLDSRYPVLVTMVLPFSLKIWFRSIFWRWIFCWFIQKFWFIQCKNLDIDSKTYSSICFSAKIQFKVLFKT